MCEVPTTLQPEDIGSMKASINAKKKNGAKRHGGGMGVSVEEKNGGKVGKVWTAGVWVCLVDWVKCLGGDEVSVLWIGLGFWEAVAHQVCCLYLCSTCVWVCNRIWDRKGGSVYSRKCTSMVAL